VPEDPALATPADGRKPWISDFGTSTHIDARRERDATRRERRERSTVDAVEDLARADARTRRESRRRE